MYKLLRICKLLSQLYIHAKNILVLIIKFSGSAVNNSYDPFPFYMPIYWPFVKSDSYSYTDVTCPCMNCHQIGYFKSIASSATVVAYYCMIYIVDDIGVQ